MVIGLVKVIGENSKGTMNPKVWVKSEANIDDLDQTISRSCLDCPHLVQLDT